MNAFLLAVMAVLAMALVGAFTFSVLTGNWLAVVVPLALAGAVAYRDYRKKYGR